MQPGGVLEAWRGAGGKPLELITGEKSWPDYLEAVRAKVPSTESEERIHRFARWMLFGGIAPSLMRSVDRAFVASVIGWEDK